MWALLGTLAAWYASTRACDASRVRGRVGWCVASALAALAAPAFSAIGLLAAPTGIVVATRPRARPGRRSGNRPPRSRPRSGRCHTWHWPASFATGRSWPTASNTTAISASACSASPCAPIDVLFPGLIGMPNIDSLLAPLGIDIALFGLGLAAILVCSWSSPRRSVMLGGLVLILGGYGVTYCVRTVHGPHWILHVERYHLFPQLGFSLLLAAALRPWLSRFDSRPARSLGRGDRPGRPAPDGTSR